MDFAEKPEDRKGMSPEAAEPLQPGLVPIEKPVAEVTPQDTQPVPRFVIWSHRLSLVVLVVFCIELGMFLAILPWLDVWNQNSFLAAYPGIRAFVQNNFVRGIVSGLGLVDIWIGIWEAVHYRDPVK
jgi:hypothetical protein